MTKGLRGALLVLFTLWLGGCGTPQKRVTWDEVATDIDEARPAATPKLSPEQLARTYYSARACEADARELARQDTDAAWRLMRGCMARQDFQDLYSLVDDPWRDRCANDPTALPLVVNIIARRGADDPRADLRQLGVATIAPDETVDATTSKGVPLVILRARVEEVATPQLVVMAEMTLEQPGYGRGRYFRARRNAAPVSRPTGRRLRAAIAAGTPLLDVGAEYLVLLTALRSPAPGLVEHDFAPPRFALVHAALLRPGP